MFQVRISNLIVRPLLIEVVSMTNRLKKLRQKSNLTLKELSEQLSERNVKISADALAKYERGDREPKIDKWNDLAEFYGVSTSYLMGIDSHKPKNRLRVLRNKTGLSQNKLVSSFNNYLAKNKVKGITVATYSRWENSNNSPTKEMWKHLANYFNVSVPYIRGDIDAELIAKIAKMIFLTHATDFDVYLNQNDLFTGYDEDDTTIACKLMLLLLQQLNLNISEEYEKIVDKTEKILGKSDSDPAVNRYKTKQYLSDITDDCSENNFEKDIEDAKKLIDFYDKL